MEYRINEDELKLLTFVCDKALGFGDSFMIQAKDLTETGLDSAALTRAATYLEGWGFVHTLTAGGSRGASASVLSVGPLSLGEAYMREVAARLQADNKLERGKRLGLAALSGIMDAGLKVAVSVLSDVARRHL